MSDKDCSNNGKDCKNEGNDGKKTNPPPSKDQEGKSQPRQSSPSKTNNKTEKSNSGRASKDGKRGPFTGSSTSTSRVASSRSQTGSSTGRSQTKSSTNSGKLTKGRERSVGRNRQKRKIKTVMAQIVKQVRRDKSKSGKYPKTIEKSEKSGKSEKSEKCRPTKSKSASSGKVVKSTRSSGRAAPNRKKKTSRSLQQLHVLEKSVFRSKLESQNPNTDPVPYQWVQTELGKTQKFNPCVLQRINSESSLVGKSIIYSNDMGHINGQQPTMASDNQKCNNETEQEFFSMQALVDEITHIEANDIFESGY